MERIIVLALVLVVFMFATATAPINTPKISKLNQTLSIEGGVVPCGDPYDGGPPGLRARVPTSDPIDGGPPGTLM